MSLLAAVQGLGPGGELLGILGGGVSPGSQNADPISDQKLSLPHPFSDLVSLNPCRFLDLVSQNQNPCACKTKSLFKAVTRVATSKLHVYYRLVQRPQLKRLQIRFWDYNCNSCQDISHKCVTKLPY